MNIPPAILLNRLAETDPQHPSEVEDPTFPEWLQIYYPQIEVDTLCRSHSAIELFLHHMLFLAISSLIIGILTGFRTSHSPFLLVVLLIDPISQLLLPFAQKWLRCDLAVHTALGSRMCIGMVMAVVWIVYIIGWVYAGTTLFETYAGQITV